MDFILFQNKNILIKSAIVLNKSKNKFLFLFNVNN